LHERHKRNLLSEVKTEARISARAFELGDTQGLQMKRKVADKPVLSFPDMLHQFSNAMKAATFNFVLTYTKLKYGL